MNEPVGDQPFRILHVCTGNIGRSPMAERLMRMHLQAGSDGAARRFAVTSAGTWGCDGAEMERFAALALAERGGDPSGFAARELTDAILAQTDLVLTATREHRSEVVRLRPQVVRWTFTLKEFARLSGVVRAATTDNTPGSSTKANAFVELAGRLRGMGDRPAPAEDDVVDPLGAPVTVYRQRAAEIDEACRQIVDLLASPPH